MSYTLVTSIVPPIFSLQHITHNMLTVSQKSDKSLSCDNGSTDPALESYPHTLRRPPVPPCPMLPCKLHLLFAQGTIAGLTRPAEDIFNIILHT